jgi:hypothetical protein
MVLMIGMPCAGAAQDSGAQQPSAREQLQHIHTPQSIDRELGRLTKDLELTREQQQRVRPLLVEHHDRIQVLLDKNPKASRQELGPQIQPSATRRTKRFMPRLQITRRNWQKRCGNASIRAKKTDDPLRQPVPRHNDDSGNS